MTDSHPALAEIPSVVNGDELAELLGRQHTELRKLLCRLPLLHAGAREDVFLRARRLLAIHLELEAVLQSPPHDGAPDRFRLDEEIVAAEQVGLESIDFDAALARVAVAFLRHVGVQVGVRLPRRLSPRTGEAVAAAIRLWEGRGDAYLGNTWSDMVATVSDQLVSEEELSSR
jgi:hypothetical protein